MNKDVEDKVSGTEFKLYDRSKLQAQWPGLMCKPSGLALCDEKATAREAVSGEYRNRQKWQLSYPKVSII